MKVLGLDTTRKIAKVFVFNKENNQELVLSLNENIKHSEGLFLYIEKILFETRFDIENFDYLACVVGPGSFTGIRVGMSTIKGFNKVINKQIVPINTFELFLPIVKNGIILLNSTSTSCYFAKIKNKQIVETGVVNKKDIKELVGDNKIYILREEQLVLGLEYNDIEVIENINELYSKCIMDKIEKQSFSNFVPCYLQLSQAERNLKSE